MTSLCLHITSLYILIIQFKCDHFNVHFMKTKLLLPFLLPYIEVSSTCLLLPSGLLDITLTKSATILLIDLEVKRLVESISVTIHTQVYVLQLSSETKWSSRKCFLNVHLIILRSFTKPPSLESRFPV